MGKQRGGRRRGTAAGQRSEPGWRTPTGTLRVIGGRLRGRPIEYLGQPSTKPMKQRIREAIFNLLGPGLNGLQTLDLFAGTGALTWEALSRGADQATLIERHFPTARLLEQNARQLDLQQQVELVRGDAFRWIRENWPQVVAGRQTHPWLVFCCPPYDFYVSRRDDMLTMIDALVRSLPATSRLVVESDRRLEPADLPDSSPWDVRVYRPAQVAITSIPK